MAVGPPSSWKMSETLCMLQTVRLEPRTVNMINVDQNGNLSLMSKEAGDRLRQARGKHFKSAASAARYFGISASTYRAHENGQNAFDVDQCAVYADKYGVSASWLAWGIGERASETAVGVALFSRIPSLVRGVVEALRPEASPAAVDAMVKASTKLLHSQQSAPQSPSDPDRLRYLARYEAGKLLEQ